MTPLLVPPGPITVTCTGPALPDGATAVICDDDTTVNDDAFTEPNRTAVAPPRPLPVSVTVVPPAAGPCTGETPLSTGAAAEA